MSSILVFILCMVGSINSMPIKTRYVDLTHVFEETTGVIIAQKIFKFDQIMNVTSEEWGRWFKAEIYTQSTHTGTHMDAPSHWHPNGTNIDELPVSQFYGPAAVIDITQRASLNPDAEVTVEDLLEWESGTGQTLNGTIVLIRTGWESKFKDKAAYLGTADGDRNNIHYPGTSGDACRWLANNRNIKGLGSDTFSPESGVAFFSYNYDCHDVFLPKGIFILESVAVKKELPLYGAHLTALPQKIIRGSGAPTRIVAAIPEVIHNLP